MDNEDDQKPPSHGGDSRKEGTDRKMTEISRQAHEQGRSMTDQARRSSLSSAADELGERMDERKMVAYSNNEAPRNADDDELGERMNERKMVADSNNEAQRNAAATSSPSRSQQNIDDGLEYRANSTLERLEQGMADVPSHQSSSEVSAAHLSRHVSTESNPHRPVLLEISTDETYDSEPLDDNLTGPGVNVSRDRNRRPYETAASGGATSFAGPVSNTSTTAPTTWMALAGSASASQPPTARLRSATTTISKERSSIPTSEGPSPGAYRVHGRSFRASPITGARPIDHMRSSNDHNTDQWRLPPEMRFSNTPVSDSNDPPELQFQANSAVPPELQVNNSGFTMWTEGVTPDQPPDALFTLPLPSENSDPRIEIDVNCFKRHGIYWLVGIALLLVCVGAVIGIVVVVALQKSDSPATPQTNFPSASPTFSEGFLVEVIQSRSPTTSFLNSTSAQSRALGWMLSDPYTLTLEDARLVQRFVIVTLWYSTNGATWATDNTNHSVGWLEPVHECGWDEFGDGKKDLICSSNEEVIQMNLLHGDDLSGHLPAELGLLSRLEKLDISRTVLSGTIPTEVGLLTRLRLLDLSRNALTGSIPTEVGLLTRLTRMDLPYNTLRGTIPTELGLSTKLSVLALVDNTLSGSIPTEFGLLSELSVLVLVDNTLSGSIPTEFGLLSELVELYLNGNTLSSTIPTELGFLTKLSTVNLSSNTLSGSIPKELLLLSELSVLGLYTNTLIGPIPTELGLLTKLSTLNLSNNTLSGTIPKELVLLTELSVLSLYNNTLTGTIPTELGVLTDLGILSVNLNTLAGSIPTELGLLTELSNLFLGNNTLIGSIPTEVGLLTQLSRLEVSHNVFSLTIPSEIGLLERLEWLSINDNALSGSIPTEMGLLTSLLAYLELYNNNLSGKIPSSLCDLRIRIAIDCGEIGCTCCLDGDYNPCVSP